MANNKKFERKHCGNCGSVLNAIWFTALMTEEWSWNGEGYSECTAKHSLINDPESKVICPTCEKVIGTGRDFGFNKSIGNKANDNYT